MPEPLVMNDIEVFVFCKFTTHLSTRNSRFFCGCPVVFCLDLLVQAALYRFTGSGGNVIYRIYVIRCDRIGTITFPMEKLHSTNLIIIDVSTSSGTARFSTTPYWSVWCRLTRWANTIILLRTWAGFSNAEREGMLSMGRMTLRHLNGRNDAKIIFGPAAV